MSYRIFNIDNIKEWQEVYNKLPENYQHISFSPQYHKLFEYNGDGKAELFYYESDGKVFYYPYFITKTSKIGSVVLDEPVYDIKSVFGYTGPLFICKHTDFIKQSLSVFNDYCKERNFLCELIRFNPVLGNDHILRGINVHDFINVKKYVLLDLKIHSDFRENYKKNYRKEIKRYDVISDRIKKTLDSGSISKFKNLYQKQMLEKNADSYYLFSENYFNNLEELLKTNGFMYYVEDEGEMKAAVVFIFDKHTAYYYHSCRDTSDNDTRWYNKLLLDYTFREFQKMDLKYCMIGGGVTNSDDDSLLSFKKNISPLERTFVMGKRVMLKEKYNQTVEIWENQFPHLKEKYSGFLEKFRLT